MTRAVKTNFKMFSAKIISIFSLLSVFCQFVFADKFVIKPCSIHDFECQKKLYKHVLRSISNSGIPEYGIPPIDPFVVKDVNVTILDSIKIGMPDGLAKGIKKCVYDEISMNMDKKIFNMDITCDITVKGKYKITADSPALQVLLGSNKIEAEGFVKIGLDKVNIVSENNFFLRKGDGGEIYLDYKREAIRYTYNIEKAHFYIDNLLINGQDYSSTITTLLNDNWKFVMGSFGKPFMDKVIEIIYTFSHKFYEAVPAKDLILEDLSPYY